MFNYRGGSVRHRGLGDRADVAERLSRPLGGKHAGRDFCFCHALAVHMLRLHNLRFSVCEVGTIGMELTGSCEASMKNMGRTRWLLFLSGGDPPGAAVQVSIGC